MLLVKRPRCRPTKDVKPFVLPYKGLRRHKDSKEVLKFSAFIDRPVTFFQDIRFPNDFVISESSLYDQMESDQFTEIASPIHSWKRIAVVQNIETSGYVRIRFISEYSPQSTNMDMILHRLYSKGDLKYKEFADLLKQFWEFTLHPENIKEKKDLVPSDVKQSGLTGFIEGLKRGQRGDVIVLFKKQMDYPLHDFYVESFILSHEMCKAFLCTPDEFCMSVLRDGCPRLALKNNCLEILTEMLRKVVVTDHCPEGVTVEPRVILPNGMERDVLFNPQNGQNCEFFSDPVNNFVYLSFDLKLKENQSTDILTDTTMKLDSGYDTPNDDIAVKVMCDEKGDRLSVYQKK